jgi:beta-lactamase regulating signal transducer with metallopeptidase domain
MVPITLPAPWAPISLTAPDTVITPPHSALPQDILGSAGNNQTQNPGTAWPEEQNQGQGLTGSTNPATSVSGQTGSESGLLAPASDLSGSASGLAGSTSSARISGILAGITLFDILITIWLLGAAAFLCTRGIAVLRFRVWLHRSWRYCDSMDVTRFVRQTMTETGFQRDMDIMVCRGVTTAFVTGLIRPALVLPEQTYDLRLLAHIIRHEITHCRRRDLWYKLVLDLANALHWFNPLVWIMNRAGGQDLELVCDELVVRGQNAALRREYGESILLTVKPGKTLRLPVLTTAFSSGVRDLRQRFENIMATTARRSGTIFLLLLVLLAVLLGSAARIDIAIAGTGTGQNLSGSGSDQSDYSDPSDLSDQTGYSGQSIYPDSDNDIEDQERFTGNYGSNLIPNGNCEESIPFRNFGDAARNGTNTFALDTDPAHLNITGGISNGRAALRIQQNSRNAFAGCPVSLERDITYDYEFDILLLHDSDGKPVSNLNVVRNIVFSDINASNFEQNHLEGSAVALSSGEWKHIKGFYTPKTSVIASNATPENAYFAIYVHNPEGKLVTYVIDNVKLVKRGQPQNLIPNGNLEKSIPLINCGNGSNVLTLETDPTNIRDGCYALRVKQNNSGAHIGYQYGLERDCEYEFEYDIKIISDSNEGVLTDANGNPLSEVWVGTNFMFPDANASAGKHHIVLEVTCRPGYWTHVKGTWKPSPLDPNAQLEGAWFAIYPHVPQSVTYVLDNVKLVRKR